MHDVLTGVLLLQAQVDLGPFVSVDFDRRLGNFTFDPGLSPGIADGEHTIHFRARDTFGNISPFTDVSFTLDTTPPAAVAPTGTLTDTFSFFDVFFGEPMADSPAAASVFAAANYSLQVVGGSHDGQAIPIELVPLSLTGVRVNLSGPLPGQSYRFTISSNVSDVAGNPLADPRVFQFTVPGQTDGDPPVIDAHLLNDTGAAPWTASPPIRVLGAR